MILGFVLAVIVHYGLCLFLADYGNPKNRAGREFFLLARYAERVWRLTNRCGVRVVDLHG